MHGHRRPNPGRWPWRFGKKAGGSCSIGFGVEEEGEGGVQWMRPFDLSARSSQLKSSARFEVCQSGSTSCHERDAYLEVHV